jgi:alkyl hydroperoxide reductase subunit AhpC
MTPSVGDFTPPVRVEAYVRDQAEPVSLEIGNARGSWTVLFFYPGAPLGRAGAPARRLIRKG